MTYIYPTTDPEILKLGYRMALYSEPKPEIKSRRSMNEQLEYNLKLIDWYKSFIVYLKEPEFKIGDEFYNIGDIEIEGRVESISGYKVYYRDVNGKPCWNLIKSLSHYYPGQQYDGEIKYVRKYFDAKEVHGAILYLETFEWKEVEEVKKPEFINYLHNKYISPTDTFDKDRELYTQFQADIKSAEVVAIIKLKQ